MIDIKQLTKIYPGATSVTALDEISLTLPDTGMVFFLGRSGSGKTTLLNLLGGLDSFQSGDIQVDGISLQGLSPRQLDAYRNAYTGFVFQEYNLLDELTVAENIALAPELQQAEASKATIEQALAAVQLDGFQSRKPGELSGGQKQRVAIARALIKNPRMLLADEPTGALDTDNSRQVWDILKELSRDRLVVVVSHDRDYAARYADRIIELADGRVLTDSAPLSPDPGAAEAKALSVPHTRLPRRIARRMAWNTLRTKKLRLAAVVGLSVVAFLLVGLSDTFSGYRPEEALFRALYEEQSAATALRKEKQLDYGEGADWYHDGFRLSEDEVAALGEKTGRTVKGVYALPQAMNIEQNYGSTEVSNKNYSQYVAELSGFMELSSDDLPAFGLELLAGRLPDGARDEIALSRYVLDSFAAAGYLNYTGPHYTVLHEDGSKTEYTFDEWVAAYHTDMPLISYQVGTDTALYTTPATPIAGAEDLIGKTLFIGDRNYTVTGIVETHFNTQRYANTKLLDVTSSSESDLKEWMRYNQLNTERQYGLSTLAFVGSGKIQDIAGRFPSTVTIHDGKVRLDNEYLNSVTATIARLDGLGEAAKGVYCIGTVDETGQPCAGLPEALAEREVLAPEELHNPVGKDTKTVAAIQSGEAFRDLQCSVTFTDGRTAWSSAGYKITGFLNLWRYYGQNIYAMDDLLVVSDSTFERLAEGRGGLYTYAIASLPREKAALRQFLTTCSAASGDIRYAVVKDTTLQMDTLAGSLTTATRLLRYVGLALTVFAALLMFQFISVSIAGRKRQIGIMRALGAGQGDVFRIFLYESLLTAALNALLACLLVFVAAAAANRVLAAQYGLLFSLLQPGIRQVSLLVLLSFGVALVSCYIPIRRIARQKPVDAIRS